MTPKSKAKELVNKFRPFAFSENGRGDASTYNSKNCALISVGEVLSTFSIFAGDQNGRDYWNEVKKEIEKLK
jgi:hypothetical protein